MTQNFKFCNEEFFDFLFKNIFAANKFYNQFNLAEETSSLIESIGNVPSYHLVFKYNPVTRTRATFICFDGELEELDVRCICILYNGDRGPFLNANHIFFFEVYEDSTIGCIEVLSGFDNSRKIHKLNVGTDIDSYFELVCSVVGKPQNDAVAMIFYNGPQNRFRLLDLSASDFQSRSEVLLGGVQPVICETKGDINFMIFKSTMDDSFIAARTIDGKTPVNVMLEDIELFK